MSIHENMAILVILFSFSKLRDELSTVIIIYQNMISAAQFTEYTVDWKVYELFLFVILLLSGPRFDQT